MQSGEFGPSLAVESHHLFIRAAREVIPIKWPGITSQYMDALSAATPAWMARSIFGSFEAVYNSLELTDTLDASLLKFDGLGVWIENEEDNEPISCIYLTRPTPRSICMLWADGVGEAQRIWPFVVLASHGAQLKQFQIVAVDGMDIPDEFVPFGRSLAQSGLALIRWMSMKIGIADRAQLERHSRKRLARLGISDVDLLTPVVLREADANTHRAAGTRAYTHRWVVRGHIRRLNASRMTFVRPHVKGPESAPFVAPNRVAVLNR